MNAQPQKQLTLFDSTCLIVGIIVGAGIFEVSPLVAKGATNLPHWMTGMAGGLSGVPAFFLLWLVGGVVSLAGALGYAELASAYPQEGGDYVYLSRAYGRWAGFLFGWVQLAIVRPGDITIMAFVFARYASQIYAPFPHAQHVYACLAVIVLTLIHVLGVRQGKWTQNLLTVAKVAGAATIVVVALVAPTPAAQPATSYVWPDVGLALIFVLFTFGGWNEMAYVAAEVVNPARNLLRALLLGTAGVTVLYLLVNGAYLLALGFPGLAGSDAVASAAVATVFPKTAVSLVSALVCISALGAVNGLIFTGARVSYAVGADHPLFRPLGQWNTKTGTPVRALLLQGLIALGVVIGLASFKDTVLYTAAPVYLFYLATNLAVVVLRLKEPNAVRPYRVWGYPVTPILFCAVCGYLIYSAIKYRPYVALGVLGVLLLGVPLYLLSRSRSATPDSGQAGQRGC
jgi:basic amino acid/polyamine antiporter, APA family